MAKAKETKAAAAPEAKLGNDSTQPDWMQVAYEDWQMMLALLELVNRGMSPEDAMNKTAARLAAKEGVGLDTGVLIRSRTGRNLYHVPASRVGGIYPY